MLSGDVLKLNSVGRVEVDCDDSVFPLLNPLNSSHAGSVKKLFVINIFNIFSQIIIPHPRVAVSPSQPILKLFFFYLKLPRQNNLVILAQRRRSIHSQAARSKLILLMVIVSGCWFIVINILRIVSPHFRD